MIKRQQNGEKVSFWQLIFSQSKVNGAAYYGELLPRHYWEWPKETYLQRRLRYVKESQLSPIHSPNLSPEERFERFYKRLLEQYRSN